MNSGLFQPVPALWRIGEVVQVPAGLYFHVGLVGDRVIGGERSVLAGRIDFQFFERVLNDVPRTHRLEAADRVFADPEPADADAAAHGLGVSAGGGVFSFAISACAVSA